MEEEEKPRIILTQFEVQTFFWGTGWHSVFFNSVHTFFREHENACR